MKKTLGGNYLGKKVKLVVTLLSRTQQKGGLITLVTVTEIPTMSLSRTVVVGLLGLIAITIVMFLLLVLDLFIPGLKAYTIYALLILVAFFAILAIEDKDLLHAALYLAGSAIALGLIYLALFAPWVAFFQLAVYAGAVTILLIAAVSLTTRRGTGEIEEEEVG